MNKLEELEIKVRMVVILILVGLLGCHIFGFTHDILPESEALSLIETIRYGLITLAAGGSAERVAKVWKDKNKEN